MKKRCPSCGKQLKIVMGHDEMALWGKYVCSSCGLHSFRRASTTEALLKKLNQELYNKLFQQKVFYRSIKKVN